MNVTFLVGNGFDINLGLKTKYTDFYPSYLAKGYDDILSKDIKNNNAYRLNAASHNISKKSDLLDR